jgi:hypothetical protein
MSATDVANVPGLDVAHLLARTLHELLRVRETTGEFAGAGPGGRGASWPGPWNPMSQATA